MPVKPESHHHTCPESTDHHCPGCCSCECCGGYRKYYLPPPDDQPMDLSDDKPGFLPDSGNYFYNFERKVVAVPFSNQELQQRQFMHGTPDDEAMDLSDYGDTMSNANRAQQQQQPLPQRLQPVPHHQQPLPQRLQPVPHHQQPLPQRLQPVPHHQQDLGILPIHQQSLEKKLAATRHENKLRIAARQFIRQQPLSYQLQTLPTPQEAEEHKDHDLRFNGYWSENDPLHHLQKMHSMDPHKTGIVPGSEASPDESEKSTLFRRMFHLYGDGYGEPLDPPPKNAKK